MAELTPRQRAAIDWVRARAGAPVTDAGFAAARVTINFHPHRRAVDGRTVAQGLYEDGVYRNQFETGISNGGLGADRERWEDRMFGGAYRGTRPEERPKYGALDLEKRPNGACHGFGSCHLRLRPHVLARTTLTYGDSAAEPAAIGLIDALGPVLTARRTQRQSDEMFDYVEAQVHGPVALATDVEAVVIDPAFAGTAAGDWLERAAERYGYAVGWHPGCELTLDEIPVIAPGESFEWQTFCAGGRARRLAARLAGEGPLTAVHVVADDGDVQELKYLWRLLAAYGRPPRSPSTRGPASHPGRARDRTP